jgi:ribosomal protein S11
LADEAADHFQSSFLGMIVTITSIGGAAYVDDACGKVQVRTPLNSTLYSLWSLCSLLLALCFFLAAL